MSIPFVLLRTTSDFDPDRGPPGDDQLLPVGPRDLVHTAIRRALPTARLDDPAWGYAQAPGWALQMHLGAADPIGAIVVTPRGDGAPALFALAKALSCRVFDAYGKAFPPYRTV